ncbi:MAG: hypothetical protein EHM85_00140 [Desulfobacteraceae bacterium]|nr:MAG: hypothetical protein EHM85_00140 [Desulfobacteraceae bacterium]
MAVYKGYVETENNVGNTEIEAGQMVSLGENTDGEVSPMGPPDEWEKWNKKRNDRVYAGSDDGSRCLPSGLRPYSSDFDSYGKWVTVRGYGNVWTPTVIVGASWSPYRHGRWIWRGGDYIWVASEPWGWAPYHYGRWDFRTNIGWFWVPPIDNEVYWSPGYVGWVRTPDYVAWVPLAPGEIYYGRGNYGRHSVNIINVDITRVNITNVYKNVNVNNGVTVIRRNTFNTGKPTIADVDKNIIRKKIFVKNNFSVGTPDIKPTKESYFASNIRIQSAKLPPKRVRELRVKELKHSRPLIKDRDKSVLNQSVKPNSLPVNSVTTPKTSRKGRPRIEQVKPEERTMPPISQDDRGAVEERKRSRPEDREIKSDKSEKPFAPEGIPTGREKKQPVKPEEKMKLSVPVAGPADRGGKQEVKSIEKRKAIVNEGRSTVRGEKQQIKPAEKVTPSAPEGIPTGREKKQPVKPEERVKPSGPVADPSDRGGKQEVKTIEKRKAIVHEGLSTGRSEKQQVKPEERAMPSGPVIGPTVRVEKKKQQVESAEKRNAVVPERSPTPRGERQNVKPDKNGKGGEPECGPGQKDEKNPEKCPKKN